MSFFAPIPVAEQSTFSLFSGNDDFLEKSKENQKENDGLLTKIVVFWCARRDLNPHARNEH